MINSLGNIKMNNKMMIIIGIILLIISSSYMITKGGKKNDNKSSDKYKIKTMLNITTKIYLKIFFIFLAEIKLKVKLCFYSIFIKSIYSI